MCPAKVKSPNGEMVSCEKQYPEKFIKNRVSLFLRQLLEFYYDGSYICSEPSCKTKTRQLLYEGRCVNVGCKGRVVSQKFSERTTNDTLRYLQGLFDIQKYRVESNEKNLNDLPFEKEFNSIKAVVDDMMNHSKYNKVDLGSLFAFMDK